MKTLLYDGDCPFCQMSVRQLEQLTLLKGIQSLPWQEASNDDSMLSERIGSEFLLLESGQVHGGFYALARLLESRFSWTNKLLKLPGVLPCGQFFYKTVSLNRRILTPSGNMPCTCDPPFHLGYRAALWSFLLLVAFGGSAVFGASLALLQPQKSFFETAWQLTISAGSGWALNFTVFLPILYRRYWEFVQQCLVVMAIGIFWLMPVALFNWLGSLTHLPNTFLLQVTLLGVTANSLIMFFALKRRSAVLGFPRWISWLWLLLLETAGIPLFLHFKLFG